MVKIVLANPRGFCAGVKSAIGIVERVLDFFGTSTSVFVHHEIVHNHYVVSKLRAQGVVFVDSIDEVPDGAVVIFSAHGVSKQIKDRANARGLRCFDATCPLVTKVHLEVLKFHQQGFEVVMIGHRGHPEVIGTMGQLSTGIHLVETADDVAKLALTPDTKLAYVTQTTLSMDDVAQIVSTLQARYPQISSPRKEDICYATQNRQDAVRRLARQVDMVLVIGSETSSNSNRLREVAQRCGVKAHMIDGVGQLEMSWLEGVERLGITAGASAPETLVQEIVAFLKNLGPCQVEQLAGVEEKVVFPLPKSLQVRHA